MSTKITIDPLTRIEGHLSVKLEVEENVVAAAYCAGEMFRGFEVLLRGRRPSDAQQITQRICGVCPISHGLASLFAQEMAYGISPPDNGRITRNLILAANYVQSHIIHFYHLSALDFIDITAILGYTGSDPLLSDLKDWVRSEVGSKSLYPAAPFLPRYEGTYLADGATNLVAIRHYLEALDLRAQAQHAAALFAGRLPHPTAMVPGGITEQVTANKVAAYRTIMTRLKTFIDHCYVPDALAVSQAFPDYFTYGKGCGNFLAYGVFPGSNDGRNDYLPGGVLAGGRLSDVNPDGIVEQVKYSRFSAASQGRPERSDTIPEPEKTSAYSWLKAPRYEGQPMEVGPLARLLVAYARGHEDVRAAVDGAMAALGRPASDLDSAMGRHAARALECQLVANRALAWVDELRPGQPTCSEHQVPQRGAGYGLTEAPRGALGHWIEIDNAKISNYQCVVPTTWNCSPRDDNGVPGPVEQALAGTAIQNPEHPLEGARVVRAFDPCLACAVH